MHAQIHTCITHTPRSHRDVDNNRCITHTTYTQECIHTGMCTYECTHHTHIHKHTTCKPCTHKNKHHVHTEMCTITTHTSHTPRKYRNAHNNHTCNTHTRTHTLTRNSGTIGTPEAPWTYIHLHQFRCPPHTPSPSNAGCDRRDITPKVLPCSCAYLFGKTVFMGDMIIPFRVTRFNCTCCDPCHEFIDKFHSQLLYRQYFFIPFSL